MELHLGKMSGQELAQWFNIVYTTYKRNPSKYIAKLDDYCKYTPVRGGVIIEEIYIATYDKKINKKIDTIYVQALAKHQNIISVSGTEKETGVSSYLLTKSRNRLFGDQARNIENQNISGLLGYREIIWVIKLPGDNNYRRLLPEEDELFNSLIMQTYSNIKVDKIKASAVLLDYCVKEGLSAECYKNLLEQKGLNFFSRVIDTFKTLTSNQLVAGTLHTITQEFNEETNYGNYRLLLLEEIDKIKKEK